MTIPIEWISKDIHDIRQELKTIARSIPNKDTPFLQKLAF